MYMHMCMQENYMDRYGYDCLFMYVYTVYAHIYSYY